MKLDFQANRIPPLLSKQICRGLLAGPEEEREREERERHCSLVHKAFKRWLCETHVVWNSSLPTEESEELFQTFCDQLSLLVKQFQRKVVMREHRIFACHALTFFPPLTFLSLWLKSTAVWWVGGNITSPSFPKFCLCQLVFKGLFCLMSYFPLPIPCLHGFPCQGHLQSCSNRIDLSTHTISMKCCFL